MRIFISAGEPSGDLHGCNLIHHLRAHDPNLDLVGFGGDRMRGAGCDLLYPLCNLAVMWYRNVFRNLRTFFSLVDEADAHFQQHRPDAVVLIDYPGFNWWIAKRAHARGIPVIYFVPPQLWAWAGWRVKKMRRTVDHVLCSLPIEHSWFSERGVNATYIGHPYFDQLASQQIAAEFVAAQAQRPGRIVGILPGSRTQEVRENLDPFLDAMRRIYGQFPDTRFLVAAFNDAQRQIIADKLGEKNDLPVEVHVGRTPEIIRSSEVCISVSGSVGLELLHAAVPSVVCYQSTPLLLGISRLFMTTRRISLINVLADDDLVPEVLPTGQTGERVAAPIIDWLGDSEKRMEVRRRLVELRDRVAQPGACARAADYIVSVVGKSVTSSAAA